MTALSPHVIIRLYKLHNKGRKGSNMGKNGGDRKKTFSNGKERYISCMLQLLSFLLLYVLSITILKELYLFRWTADNRYLYLWIVVLILSVLDKIPISLALTIGNVVGVLLGQFIGDEIRYRNIQKITENMNLEQRAYLHIHHGFTIWIVTVLVSFIVGVTIYTWGKKSK